MGTRSRIGIKGSSGTITSIYCHWDGYLDGVGKTLQAHYPNVDKIAQLMTLGDISSLGEEIGEKHDFNSENPVHNKWCKAYGRDRDEAGTGFRFSNSNEDYIRLANKTDAEYAYLFEDGEWKVSMVSGGVGSAFVPLVEAIKDGE